MLRRALVIGGLFTFIVAGCGSSDSGGGAAGTGGAGGAGGATDGGSGADGGGAAGSAGAPDLDSSDGTIVQTDKGPVQGMVQDATRAWLGIPFAAPPVGDLRWKPPQAHAAWKDVMHVIQRGAYCAQGQALAPAFDTSSSEDCLTLNVWAPATTPSTPAPVMVWIHGGSFVTGSGGLPDYVGKKLSEATGAIVVTINYRLGPFGFLAAVRAACGGSGVSVVGHVRLRRSAGGARLGEDEHRRLRR